jgi:hypothetical protein
MVLIMYPIICTFMGKPVETELYLVDCSLFHKYPSGDLSENVESRITGVDLVNA